MIEVTDKKNCCGCEACVQSCPLNCIAMESDEEGFFYPVTDPEKCVDCGACDRACPIQNPEEKPKDISVYAARCLDNEIRRTSSSGGIFSLLAGRIFEKGGVVFGAAFDDDLSVCHAMARNEEEMEALKGSKYVQSRIGDTYRQTLELLKNNVPVLFTGTSCQIAGLRSFLPSFLIRNLYTVEILCHGVPSPALWKRFIREQEAENNSAVEKVVFRDKAHGWHQYSVNVCFQNARTYQSVFHKDKYMKLFLKDICLRPSCHDCKFRQGRSGADLTIGDAWGIEKWMPEMDDDMGTSVVVVNTEKGRGMVADICQVAEIRQVEPQTALAGNPVYYRSVKPHPNRQNFFNALKNSASMEALLAFCKEPLSKRILSFAKRAAKKLLRRS